MNAVPTADGGPRVIVQTVGPIRFSEAAICSSAQRPALLRSTSSTFSGVRQPCSPSSDFSERNTASRSVRVK